MIFPDLSKKACKCCGGSARGFILFVSEEDNNNSDKVNGVALCYQCFDRVSAAATNELELDNDKDPGVIHIEDIKWD